MTNSNVSASRVYGIHQLIEHFDVLVVDQYGVLHDGNRVYPGAIDCLRQVKERDKFIVALSNSGRRASSNVARLQNFGYHSTLFDYVLTSGETTWMALTQRDIPFLQKAKKVFLINGLGTSSILDGLDFVNVDQAHDADFVLITGAEQARFDIQYYHQLLLPAMQAKLPCICANPDVHSLLDGSVTYGPAAIAQHYETSGAEVIYFGKPYLPIYTKMMNLIQLALGDCASERILCIGDSPAHDIRGANSANMRSVLVETGLQGVGTADDLDCETTPDFILPSLTW